MQNVQIKKKKKNVVLCYCISPYAMPAHSNANKQTNTKRHKHKCVRHMIFRHIDIVSP